MAVLLLGAGASKSYGESPTGQRMPIAADFFSTFESLDIYCNPWVLKEGLLDYLVRGRNVNDPLSFLRSGVNIEDLHTEIEERLINSLSSGDDFEPILLMRPYVELSFIFAAVINQIQNGPISKPHLSLARYLSSEDTIITFNWDTLMERALSQEKGWTVDDGYRFRPKRVFRDNWVDPNFESKSTSPSILKLHGSTNWITAYQTLKEGKVVLSHESPPETVCAYEYSKKPYECYAGRYQSGYEPFSYGYYPPNLTEPGMKAPNGYVFLSVRSKVPWKPEGTAGDEGLVSMPLIIPPVRYKKYDLFGDLFSQLWDKAREALSTTDHIIIIGYSFPRTDLKSHDLFINSFMQRTSIPKVTIIDPNPYPVKKKFLLDFGIPEGYITVVKDYFSEKLELGPVFNRS